MDQLVCKICGSNAFVAENKLSVCQNCGCKYTANTHEIINISNKDNEMLDVEASINAVKNSWSNIPCFNKETDNQIYAQIKKIGHIEKEAVDAEVVDAWLDETPFELNESVWGAIKVESLKVIEAK